MLPHLIKVSFLHLKLIKEPILASMIKLSTLYKIMSKNWKNNCSKSELSIKMPVYNIRLKWKNLLNN